jgi:hypothetical protein
MGAEYPRGVIGWLGQWRRGAARTPAGTAAPSAAGRHVDRILGRLR